MVCWLYLQIFVGVLAVIYFVIKLYLSPPTKWCKSKRCLVGKTAVITGANVGIGYYTALDFAKRGAKVILACRDRKRAENARQQIIEETDNPKIFVKIVDFNSFNSVRAFAKEMYETEERLDILVNNAGISYAYDTKTEDGCDCVIQVNYYSHFLLTHLLLDLLKKSGDPSRIVNVSSLAAAYAVFFDVNNLETFPGNFAIYANSKLCNILFTKELAKRIKNTSVTTYSLHPGPIKTGIFRNCRGLERRCIDLAVTLFYKPAKEGAETTIYCSVEKNIEKYSGDHFDNCRRVNDYKTARDPGLPRKLWEITEKVVNLTVGEKIHYKTSF